MQGRPDQSNNTWDRDKAATARLAELQATGQQRTLTGANRPKGRVGATGETQRIIPQRPPTMRHIDAPPETPRAPRPVRQAPETKKTHRLMIALGVIVAIFAVIAFVIVFLVIGAANQAAGPTATVTDFLSSLSSKNYSAAYHDLGPAVTIRLNAQEFTTLAQQQDQKYGAITTYNEIDGSATITNNVESFSYTITRAKEGGKPYKLTISLQQDPDYNNEWRIVDYGPTLGPTQ